MRILDKPFVFLFILYCPFLFGQKHENDWQKMNLRGKVKSTSEYCYKAEDSLQLLKQNTKDYDIRVYSDNGYLLTQKVSDWELHFRIFQYDKKDELILCTTITEGDKVDEKFKYDVDGNEIERDYIRNDTTEYEKNFTKNEKWGEIVTYNEKDANWSEIDSIKKDSAGNTSSFLYPYPNPTNKPYISKCRYDSKGNILEALIYSKEYKPDSIEYFRFKYNKMGDQISSEFNTEQGSVVNETFIYKFDKIGNWTRREELNNGKLIKIYLREITYYKD